MHFGEEGEEEDWVDLFVAIAESVSGDSLKYLEVFRFGSAVERAHFIIPAAVALVRALVKYHR